MPNGTRIRPGEDRNIKQCTSDTLLRSRWLGLATDKLAKADVRQPSAASSHQIRFVRFESMQAQFTRNSWEEGIRNATALLGRLQRSVRIGQSITIQRATRYARARFAIIAFIFGVYMLHMRGLLRLTEDSIVYLSMTTSWLDGDGFTVNGESTQFPIGYPMILGLVERSAGAGTTTIVGLSLLSLSLGVMFFRKLAADVGLERRSIDTACIGFLSSFIVVKHLPLPLSDIPFFMVSMFTLMTIQNLGRFRDDWRTYMLAMVSALSATMLRTIGIALIMAVAMSSLDIRTLVERCARNRLLMLVISSTATCGIAIAIVLVRGSTYFDQAAVSTKGMSWPRIVATIMQHRLRELGEICTNIPRTKMPIDVDVLFLTTGVAFSIIVVLGIRASSVGIKSGLHTFLGTYVAVMLVWPRTDTRLWLPVLPLFLVFAIQGLETRRFERLASLRFAYGLAFCCVGLVALGLSARLSVSGSDTFIREFGDGSLAPTYRAAFEGGPFGPEVDLRAYEILVRYGR